MNQEMSVQEMNVVMSIIRMYKYKSPYMTPFSQLPALSFHLPIAPSLLMACIDMFYRLSTY